MLFDQVNSQLLYQTQVRQTFMSDAFSDVSCSDFYLTQYIKEQIDFVLVACVTNDSQSPGNPAGERLTVFYSQFVKNQTTSQIIDFTKFSYVHYTFQGYYQRHFQMLLQCRGRQIFYVSRTLIFYCPISQIPDVFKDLNNTVYLWDWEFDASNPPNNISYQVNKLQIYTKESFNDNFGNKQCGQEIQIFNLITNPKKYDFDAEKWDFLFLNVDHSICKCLVDMNYKLICSLLQLDFIYNYTQVQTVFDLNNNFQILVGSDQIVQEIAIDDSYRTVGSLQSQYIINSPINLQKQKLMCIIANLNYFIVQFRIESGGPGRQGALDGPEVLDGPGTVIKIFQRNEKGGNHSHYSLSFDSVHQLELFYTQNFYDQGDYFFLYDHRSQEVEVIQISQVILQVIYNYDLEDQYKIDHAALNITYNNLITGKVETLVQNYEIIAVSFDTQILMITSDQSRASSSI